jgi:hypothetical protein
MDLLTYDIVPKAKKNFIYASVIFVVMIPIFPFFPAKHTRKLLVQSMSYEKALLVSCSIVLMLIAVLYYFSIYLLHKDISLGYKLVCKTRISRKKWKNRNKFILELSERPKNFRSEIELDGQHFYDWLKDDVIEICYLKHTGDILSYKKLTD